MEGRNLGPQDKVVTYYSLTLRGTINPETFGFTSSMAWNTWLVPNMCCRVPLGTGITRGFGMLYEMVWPGSKTS